MNHTALTVGEEAGRSNGETNMRLIRIDVDTVSWNEPEAPDHGTVIVEIGGRRATLRLDDAQIARVTSLASEIAAEILAEIAAQEPAAA